MYVRMDDTQSEEVIDKFEVVKEMIASSTPLQKRIECRLTKAEFREIAKYS